MVNLMSVMVLGVVSGLYWGGNLRRVYGGEVQSAEHQHQYQQPPQPYQVERRHHHSQQQQHQLQQPHQHQQQLRPQPYQYERRHFSLALSTQRSTRLSKSSTFSEEAVSLSALLTTLVTKELEECHIVLVHDGSVLYSEVAGTILNLLPNSRQVVVVRGANGELRDLVWVSPGCAVYLLMLYSTQPLMAWVQQSISHPWDYAGRYLVVCRSLDQLETLVDTGTGTNTEHFMGVVKGGRGGEWRIYSNIHFYGTGVKAMLTWRHGRFSSGSRQLFQDKMADLRGAMLKISTFKFEPAIMYYYAKDGTLDYRYGVDIALVKALGYALNFNPTFSEPPDGETWGYELSNGSWTGTFGALLRGEADIVVSNLFVSSGREELLDFTAPYKVDMTCFLTRTEPPLPRWHALAFPFHPWSWLAIFIGLIVSGPILYLLAASSGRWGDEVKSLGMLGFSCYYSLSMHTRESQVLVPRMASTRVFVIFLWFYTMVLTISYSTNLTAFLLVRKQPQSMQTIQDIYQSGLDLISLTDVYRDGIASSSNEYLQRLLSVYSGLTSAKEIFPQVMAGKAVYLENRRALEFQTSTCFTWRGVPRVRILRECYTTFNVAMALRLHSPLKRKFDEMIGLLQQSGLLEHYFRDSLRLAAASKDSRTCSGQDGGQEETENQDSHVIPLSLEHLQGLFFIMCIGWALALVCFIFEVFKFRD